MGTTADKLNKLKATKEAIRTAINNKGGTLTTSDKFSDYATAIDNIQSGSTNESITITENGTYTAPEGVGYSPITVNVPQSVASGTVKNLLDATKSCYYLFYEYKGTSVDDLISYTDTSSVTNMNNMFYNCSNLTTIPQLDTSSATNMYNMFYNCSNLTTIPQLDTSKVTSMRSMFYQCSNLTTIPQLDTSKVTDMRSMFSSCSNLTTIPQLDTSKVTDMVSMFSSCSKLQSIIQLDTSSCKETTNMFYQCRNLTTIQQLDTSKVTDMYQMFYQCNNLTTIPQLDTSSCTRLSGMFSGCVHLQTIDITHMKTTSTYSTDEFCRSACSLKKLIIRNMDAIPTLNSNAFQYCYHFYGTTNATYNPEGLKDGRIYVPDDKVEELKTATNWSVFADIIVPLSTLVEE